MAFSSAASAETITIGNSLAGKEVTLALCTECTVFQSAQSGATVTSPVAGSVTSWSYRSGDKGANYELEVLHPTGGGTYALSAKSPQITVEDNEAEAIRTVTLATPLPIQPGDSVGLHVESTTGVPTSGAHIVGDEMGEIFKDAPGKASLDPQQELLLQATVTTNPPPPPPPPPPPLPPPVVTLTPVQASTSAGKALLFTAGASNLAGRQITRFEYSFTGGATANCAGSYPVLSAIFNRAVTGTVTVTATASDGTRSISSAPFSVLAARRVGKRAITASQLTAYTCAPTPASTPQNSRLGACLRSAPTTGGYVEIFGCLSQTSFSDLPAADRVLLPLSHLHKLLHRPPPTADSSADVFFAASTPVHIDGLVVTPAPGHDIIFAHAGVSDTILAHTDGYYVVSGSATVSLATEGTSLTLPLQKGPISWEVSDTKREEGVAVINGVTLKGILGAAIPGLGGLAGQVLGAIPEEAIKEIPEAGTALTGKLGFMLSNKRLVTNIPIDLTNLPFSQYFGQPSGFRVTIALTAENDPAEGSTYGQPKLTLGDFNLAVKQAFIGPLTVENIFVHYSRSGEPGKGVPANSITGGAQALIASGLFSVTLQIVGATPTRFHIEFHGSQQLIPPQIFLTSALVDLDFVHLKLTGEAHVSVFGGSIAPGCGIAGANGKGEIDLEPFLIELSSSPEVVCTQSPTTPGEYFRADEHGYFTEGAFIDFNLPKVGSVKGNLSGTGYFAPNDNKYHVRFEGNDTTTVLGGSIGAQVLLSDEGMALCGELSAFGFHWHPGVGESYEILPLLAIGKTAPPVGELAVLAYLAARLDFKTDGCDINKYSSLPPGRPPGATASAAQAGSAPYGFTVPAHERAAIVLLHGQGGVPGAILHGPGGRTIDAPATGTVATATELVLHLAPANETEIEIAGANAGSWTIEAAPGSVPIAAVDLSHELPPPSITGRVTGSGATRALRYQMRNIPAGTKVTFVESGTDGGADLGSARGARGTLRFTPSDARAGTRTIVAVLTSADGMPRPSITVTRYSAAPPRPGRPSHLLIRHRGTSLRITFRPAPGATHQIVSALLSDGRTPLFVLGARARGVTIRKVPRGVRAVKVVVQGLLGGVGGPSLTGSG